MPDNRRDTTKSLRKRILSIFVLALVVLAAVMGSISVYVVDKLSETDSQKIMTQLCEKETLRFDNKLALVQHSVEIIYEYAKELQSLNGDSDVYSEAYEKSLRDFSITIANKTEGAMSVYFRYNPEITKNGTDGFFWSRISGGEKFKEEAPTDILAYNSSDKEHVGWFYAAKESGKPLWMTPYYNQNIGVFMISYIIPLYAEKGEFAGLIGMDIDFKSVVNETHGLEIYESGSIAWVNLKERLIYYVNEMGQVESGKLSNALYNHITTINKSNELLEITDKDGTAFVICCRKIRNGMMLYVNVPKREIDREQNRLFVICVLITCLLLAVSLFFILRRTAKVVYPLERLTEITNEYAKGKWTSKYISDTGDEIQKLSEGIARMAKNTQDYIKRLNNLARTDAVTGLANKTSYLEMVERIKKNRKNKFNEYAVVAMDLNLLKRANDTYGHESGDLLIKEASDYISRIFSESPVFRTGGDEFVVILYGEAYENREETLREFEDGMNYPVSEIPGLILSISFGMAEFPADAMDYDGVFELADERMYQKKKELKMERRD